jgi:spoIIIJ-associated protein
MRSAQGQGPTFEEAVDAALIELGESRRNVDVKVLSETNDRTVVEVMVLEAGGTSGSISAPVVSARAEIARDRVSQLLTLMGITAQVGIREGDDPIVLDVSGRDLGLLIGWRGETLRALQAITNLLVSKGADGEQRVIVDVERYRQRREHTVKEIAYRAARQVMVTGDPITLDAMQPFERRAIHLALEEDPNVMTVSIGEEPTRRVVVGPRRKAVS